jgi:hypothetical protein
MSGVSFGILRDPSASIPFVMSLAALALVVGVLVTVGVTHEADEGTPARVWQLLMAGQLPLVAYFAIKWLPRRPSQALFVLALQAAAGVAAAAPVFLLELSRCGQGQLIVDAGSIEEASTPRRALSRSRQVGAGHPGPREPRRGDGGPYPSSRSALRGQPRRADGGPQRAGNTSNRRRPRSHASRYTSIGRSRPLTAF